MLSGQCIRNADASELAWANEQYGNIGFALSTSADRIWVAERGGERLGLGRLVTFAPDKAELGGIYVIPAARRGGIARAIVSAVLTDARAISEVWCIPFADLEPFYRSFDLLPIARPWPPYVTEKVADCERRALPPVSVLVRRPARGGRDALDVHVMRFS